MIAHHNSIDLGPASQRRANAPSSTPAHAHDGAHVDDALQGVRTTQATSWPSEALTGASAIDAAIRAIAQPPTLCPSCWYEEQTSDTPFPCYASTRLCPRHCAVIQARAAIMGAMAAQATRRRRRTRRARHAGAVMATPAITCPHCRSERHLAPLPTEGAWCAMHNQCGECVICTDNVGQPRTWGPSSILCADHRKLHGPTDTWLHYCPHCYKLGKVEPPEGYYRQACRAHERFTLDCPDCTPRCPDEGCRTCGDLGSIFFSDMERAEYAFDVPHLHPRHTRGDTWLADLIRRTSQSDEWDRERWELTYINLDGLTKPGAPWWNQRFADLAMKTAIDLAGEILLGMVPTVCAACLAESDTPLQTPPKPYLLYPCETHLAQAEATCPAI
jgi:hypothetical protein